MSTLVASILSGGDKQNYERLLFVKYAMLDEYMKAIFPGYRTTNQLSLLNHLRGQDIVNHATPFFWMNIRNHYSNGMASSEHFGSLRRYLLMTSFDAYFELLPDGTSFKLDAVNDSNIVMPKLGVYIPSSSNVAILRRKSSYKVEIETSGQRYLINLDNIDPNLQIPTIKIPGYPQTTIISIRDPALFEKDYIDSIEPDLNKAYNIANMIAKSFDVINSVDSKLASRIISLIKWFVPTHSLNMQSHNIFTAKNLIGVLFLSEAPDYIDVIDAIIHEFHHTELYMLMETQQILQEHPGEKFYAPWRDDPRPLYGFFHGIYVHSALIDFYSQIERSDSTKRVYGIIQKSTFKDILSVEAQSCATYV